MIKPLALGTLLLTLPFSLPAADIYLEGISILGTKKTAYVMLNNEKISVEPGDSVDTWTVETIGQRAITLRGAAKEDGTPGEIRELLLHDRLNETPEPPQPDNPFARALQEQQANQANTPQQNKPENTAFKPRQIPDDQIPEGHHRVRTPFGDVLVKDNK